MAGRDPATRAVLDMPFANYVLWAYAFGSKEDPFAADRLPAEYQRMRDLTKDLLTRYRGSGKTFYLGNWEGDWHLPRVDPRRVPTPEEVQRMIEWVNTRQKAVDDAKREVAPSGVNVFYYKLYGGSPRTLPYPKLTAVSRMIDRRLWSGSGASSPGARVSDPPLVWSAPGTRASRPPLAGSGLCGGYRPIAGRRPALPGRMPRSDVVR